MFVPLSASLVLSLNSALALDKGIALDLGWKRICLGEVSSRQEGDVK